MPTFHAAVIVSVEADDLTEADSIFRTWTDYGEFPDGLDLHEVAIDLKEVAIDLKEVEEEPMPNHLRWLNGLTPFYWLRPLHPDDGDGYVLEWRAHDLSYRGGHILAAGDGESWIDPRQDVLYPTPEAAAEAFIDRIECYIRDVEQHPEPLDKSS